MKLSTTGARAVATAVTLAAGLAVAGAAAAQTVANTSLQDLDGATWSTNTTANGTLTTSSGARIGGAPAAGQWVQSEVGGGGAVGITRTYSNDGNGAAYFSTSGGASKADLVLGFAQPVLLSNLESVSFDFYRSPGSANFAPVLRFLMTEDNGFAGSLVLEYVYQTQTAVPDGWTTLTADLDSGIFWATNAALGPVQAAAVGGQKTLQQWMDANGTLRVVGVSIGVGSGWNAPFAGAVDHVAFSFEGGPTQAYDFAVVPEPTTWALMILGLGGAGAMVRRRRAAAAA